MRWLKGVVISTSKISSAVEIELDTGQRCWAAPHFKLGIREAVLISWDYTNNRVDTITTKERRAATDTERTRAEASMNEVFQSPSNEELEEDLSDTTETSSKQKPGRDAEYDSMVDVFRNPTGEDVDCDSIVELRKDINY